MLRAEYLLQIAQESLADLPGQPQAGFKRMVKRVPVGPILIAGAWNVSNATEMIGRYTNEHTVPLPDHRQCPDPSSPGRKQCPPPPFSPNPSIRKQTLRDLHRSRTSPQRPPNSPHRQPRRSRPSRSAPRNPVNLIHRLHRRRSPPPRGNG